MFPHMLHLVHLSNPDELYDFHLKLILLPPMIFPLMKIEMEMEIIVFTEMESKNGI